MREMNRMALCLADDTNEYQQLLKEDALATANRLNIQLDVYSADDKVTQQIRQIYECLQRPVAERPQAILTMAVRGSSLGRVTREVLQQGIGWLSLNRRMDEFADLRRDFANLPICLVSPDQHEIGRIQGRQFRILLPEGGRILYVQGEATSTSAQYRLEGMREAIEKHNLEVKSVLDGNWTAEDAERVIGNWLRIVMSGKSQIDLIGCQNDAMAMGAVKALKTVAEHLRRPEIARIPVTGCDGVRSFGQKLVNQGVLAATVIMPSTGGTAVELMARALGQGKQLTAEILLPAVSYPAEDAFGQRLRKLV
jgi:ABC-type sugar transport system substrate-binding protein